jgi:GNAT superfamily N-acetyltransferase
VRVVPVDPVDLDLFARWYAVGEACYRLAWPDDPFWALGELRALALDCDGAFRFHCLAVVDGEQVVGSGSVELPQRDNLHLAEVSLAVHPDHRRRGIGSALLANAEQIARVHDRTVVIGEHGEPTHLGPDLATRRFTRRRGYRTANISCRRTLRLPPDWERLDLLESQCAVKAADYEVLTWRDPDPEELVADRVLLARRMSTDAPLGELDLHEEDWDADRLRHQEKLWHQQNRTCFSAAARHLRDGRLVGFTDLVLPLSAPKLAHQWDTLALPEHRGHRLGLLMKLANLRALTAASPVTEQVGTWNAEANAPMIGVNDALGFEVTGRSVSWQRRLTPAPD